MNLKNVSSHFRFGENWESYVRTVDDGKIAEAIKGIQKLIPPGELQGKQILDIGCGSGLSMLAMLRLGAASVKGIDIDQNSVNATQALLARYAPDQQWSARQGSVFDLDPQHCGQFDIVHSWGVLHHTGDMWAAIAKAAALVKKDGLFVIALYHKTPMCGFWGVEKKFYSRAKQWQQRIIMYVYVTAYMAAQLVLGKNPLTYISECKDRGMDWHHDIHDWLGGFPYDSTIPTEVVVRLQKAGFKMEQIFAVRASRSGLFGTGCDEYVARRIE